MCSRLIRLVEFRDFSSKFCKKKNENTRNHVVLPVRPSTDPPGYVSKILRQLILLRYRFSSFFFHLFSVSTAKRCYASHAEAYHRLSSCRCLAWRCCSKIQRKSICSEARNTDQSMALIWATCRSLWSLIRRWLR